MSSLDYKLVELYYIKKSPYTTTILVILIAYIYIYIYNLLPNKRTLMNKSTEENGEIPIHLDGVLQNLISRKSVPLFQKQPFTDVLQSSCS